MSIQNLQVRASVSATFIPTKPSVTWSEPIGKRNILSIYDYPEVLEARLVVSATMALDVSSFYMPFVDFIAATEPNSAGKANFLEETNNILFEATTGGTEGNNLSIELLIDPTIPYDNVDRLTHSKDGNDITLGGLATGQFVGYGSILYT